MSGPIYWQSPPPKSCDLCDTPIGEAFIDGKTKRGPWACMCPPCHEVEGGQLGLGIGQRYEKKDGGIYVKVGG